MGTRALFWMGDPTDLENREWLGAIAWDGYPSGVAELAEVTTEEQFRDFVKGLHGRRDFAHPGQGFPYPWDDDIFVTDLNYWFKDGVYGCWFHDPSYPFAALLGNKDSDEDLEDYPKRGPVPATEKYNPGQPDSIMIFAVRSSES